MNKIGSESRETVHRNGMWHKTVHCWLCDDDKNVYFQIRANSGKLYTTASGHVLAGETVSDAFKREICEEIGIDLDVSNAIPLEIMFWRQDKIKNGNPWHDRAFAHVYMNKIPCDFTEFHFQEEEVAGIIRINVDDCFDLLMNARGVVSATKITQNGLENITISRDDFLTASDESAIVKYGFVLQSIKQILNK